MTKRFDSLPMLHRRTFLKGLGAAMALPSLEGMFPRSAFAAEAAQQAAPLRTAFVFFPNGAIMPSWTPQEAGEEFEFSKTLKPLEPFRQDLNVITGLAQDNGRAKGDGAGDHARCASTFLTGEHPVKTSGADIKVGISVDQVAAQQIGKLTRLPSLELGIERGRTSGNCDSGYSCAYSSAVSWKSPTTPMPKEINPRLVFERLFGDGEDERGRARRNEYRQSILDLVAEDAKRLKACLGQTDRRKVDEYFSSVREIEQRIGRAEQQKQQERPDFPVPPGIPEDQAEHIQLMFDLMLLAFQTDTTRIITFMLGNAGSNRTYPTVGVNSGHHQLSHHRDDAEKIADLEKIDLFLINEFAYFLKRLKETPEGNGTLLDHSMILYGSGLSDGNRHRHENLPIVLAGSGNGSIRTGRHIRYEHETPMNNLFLSMLDRTGAKVEKIGDSSGRLKELDA